MHLALTANWVLPCTATIEFPAFLYVLPVGRLNSPRHKAFIARTSNSSYFLPHKGWRQPFPLFQWMPPTAKGSSEVGIPMKDLRLMVYHNEVGFHRKKTKENLSLPITTRAIGFLLGDYIWIITTFFPAFCIFLIASCALLNPLKEMLSLYLLLLQYSYF